jgi:integrase
LPTARFDFLLRTIDMSATAGNVLREQLSRRPRFPRLLLQTVEKACRRRNILRDLADLLAFADCSRYPPCNRVIVLLSTKAGLRAGEIARLTWDMVLDANGQIGTCVELRDHAAKKGSGRLIPMHHDLDDALSAWRQASTGTGHVVRSERGGPMTALSIVVWFKRAYEYVGLDGCSSHLGRRTFNHPSSPTRLQSWRLITRRSAASRTSVDPNNAAVYRRRYRSPA